MVFSSLTFVFFFLTLTMAAYFIVPGLKGKNIVLLVASLLFYSWGEPKFVILMILTVAVAYFGALYIEMADVASKKKVFIVVVTIILSALVIFKYLDFILSIFGIKGPGLSLPIGISFYTFQVLSYVIDYYRGKVKIQKSFWKLLLYVSFFPQLIAGPIVRYQTVEEEIVHRSTDINSIAKGLRRFILGLSKKCIVANGVAAIANTIYTGDPEIYGIFAYWLAAICYALEIYFDFSGYSDMAIGLGKIFGFHFLENFDHPYFADSVTDFWRRWHISLSSWFRDYIYIPLGGNRVSVPRWMLNIFIVWGLTGLWHGASWNFLLWGLYYAVFLIIEKLFLGKLLKHCKPIAHVYTILVVIIGWVIFNLTDFSMMSLALTKMFTSGGSSLFQVIAADASILKGLIFVPIAILALFAQPVVDYLEKHEILANIVSIELFVISIIFVLSTSYNPFIYFRF